MKFITVAFIIAEGLAAYSLITGETFTSNIEYNTAGRVAIGLVMIFWVTLYLWLLRDWREDRGR